jgi:rhodanese-related sulfurtransferase
MNRLADYIVHHPYIVTATFALAVAAIFMEIRQRGRGSAAVGAADAVRIVNGGGLALDVRGKDEFEAGHIIDARNLPAAELGTAGDSLKKYREKPVLVYCDNGIASSAAARTLKSQGFAKVVTLRGGLNSWRQENFPVVKQTGKGKESKSS